MLRGYFLIQFSNFIVPSDALSNPSNKIGEHNMAALKCDKRHRKEY